ncbi:7TM diverse intracellular signaling domain-containing protein [Polaribacter sp.]|uniref:7TM diverse intracellular signaling domain-containing protein n=1 Tax=Polaribacter sp. TaxID=1920175 RepID=UPI003EF999FB
MKFYYKTLFFIFIISVKSYAFQKTIVLNSQNTAINLRDYATIFTSEEELLTNEIDINAFRKIDPTTDFFYFDFTLKTICLQFYLTNKLEKNKQFYVRFSNTMIHEIIVYKHTPNGFIELHKTGIKHPIKSKLVRNRNFIIPIEINSKESASYMICLNKINGRPLVTNVMLLSKDSINSKSFKEDIIIGAYVGLSFIFLLIGIVLFVVLKKSIYFFYSLYIFFLGLFILSYTGVFQQLFLSSEIIINKYLHYVVFGELAFVFFVVFSQKFLNTKKHQPKLYKIVLWLMTTLIVLRLLLHFFFNNLFSNYIPTFMKVWYLLYVIGVFLVAYQIIVLYKNGKKKNILFAIAYLFMILGSFISVIYHSFGLVNAIVFNLPLLLFTSLLELIFITIALGFLVIDIMNDKRNLLKEVAKQKQQNLKEFITLNSKTKVYLDALKYVKSDGNYLEFYVTDKKILDRNKLKTLQEILPSNFVKVHRSFIINKNYIKTTTSTSVILNPNIEIPVSRTFKENLKG